MDYSGNYYRMDLMDQLLAAGNENEATVFPFIEANKRIGSGSKTRFCFMTPTSNDEDEDQEIMINDEVEEEYNLSDDFVSAVKELTEAELPDEVEKSISEYDLSKIDWQEYLTHIAFISSGLKEHREGLVKAESDVDQKTCDVLHYIELCNTDEAEASDLVELFKACREYRRDIKDEIYRYIVLI